MVRQAPIQTRVGVTGALGRKESAAAATGNSDLGDDLCGQTGLPSVTTGGCRRQSRDVAHVETAAEIGVVTEGRSGIQASGGKGSAKHASDAGLMMAWYSAPQSLAR